MTGERGGLLLPISSLLPPHTPREACLMLGISSRLPIIQLDTLADSGYTPRRTPELPGDWTDVTDYLTRPTRHWRAWRTHPWAATFEGLQTLANRHRDRYETPIGEDCVLGPAWLAALRALRVLLNAELGDLDAGICDRYLIDLASEHGCNLDE